MRLRAISFDAAGTLFHPARPVGELYAQVAARHGVVADPAVLHPRFRAAFSTAPPLAFPGVDGAALRARERAWWRALVATVFEGMAFADFDAFFADLFAFFGGRTAWRVDPDAVPLLRAVRRRGLGVLVVSNFDARVRGVIEALGLGEAVDQITISSEAGAAKPDPRIFEVALATAGVDAREVLHVGDTVREDLAGAEASGVEVVLVGDRHELAAAAPHAHVVARLGDVDAVITRRLTREP